MEIEIESKKNNPLMNRTEVFFTVKHKGEKTPNREIIRSELADKLNAKKENIIVNSINSSFGTQETTGYAKVYSSLQKAKDLERDHILKRNKIGVTEKKKEEKDEEKKEEKPIEEKTEETPSEPSKEEPEAKPETPAEPEKPEEPSAEPEATSEPPAEEPKVEEPKEETPVEPEKPAEESADKKEKPDEEKKE